MKKQDPVVVIGGGTAGCMVATHLANHTDLPLVLVEPGEKSPHDDESRFFDVLADESFSSDVNGVIQARALGGGSAINGMLLTGEEPDFARGLTRMATHSDIGLMGEFLLKNGGRFSRLWWNGGRWNPGRAVAHLEEEGRIRIVRDSATSFQMEGGRVRAVRLRHDSLNSMAVVLCAGALNSPHILRESGFNSASNFEVQNHYSVNVVVELEQASEALFDTAVVKEISLASGEKFLVHAYERISAFDQNRALLSVVHVNPHNGQIEELALSKARAIATELSIELANCAGVTTSTVDPGVYPLSHVSSSCIDVVDNDGRVNGVSNLWVADASVLREVPHCTPAAPVTMEALRIAQMIVGELI